MITPPICLASGHSLNVIAIHQSKDMIKKKNRPGTFADVGINATLFVVYV